MGEIPYDRYAFITHFIPGMYGGLEHKNSTALHFDGTSLQDRKNYINWLCLVSHEYFHTWNVKRIRPRELGPFDYQKENHTTLLWLAEGLTSFMDELYVYRSGLIEAKEYLDLLKSAFDRYYAIPGKRFHSLEASSLNAWIKLYRPDENSNNSSISYYLKGGIVFLLLHVELAKKGKKMDHLLELLWQSYKKRPDLGLTAEEVFALVAEVGGQAIADKFTTMVQTTEDLPIEQALKDAGAEFLWETPTTAWLGVTPEFREGRVYFEQIVLDGPAYQAGINSKDELLAIDGVRIFKDQFEKLEARLIPDRNYQLTLSRNGVSVELTCSVGRKPRVLKEIQVKDEALFKRTFLR
jgi:predicted metalloprotease with PDZ domain